MKPRFRFPALSHRAWVAIVGGVGVVGIWFGAPRALRHLEFFRVRQIELVGIRNLSPDAVIGVLRLQPRASVFDDTRLLTARVRGLRGVADARVVRRLPAALKVIVREVDAVALVPGPRGMVVVDAAGRALPFDPARSGLDLPVAAAADSAVIGVVALVQAVDPALFQDITAARRWRGSRGDVLLELDARRVLLRPDAGPEVIRAVVQVAQDLAAKARPYVELDARYAGQVVVRRKASA
ncbi:MAG: FtsQ-type POTRA domain-containing protein [Gemmatimonadetes bacterium]|nr:FtsQ-type POTRA domain-containing protein [Gemmatimonadota bacterium]